MATPLIALVVVLLLGTLALVLAGRARARARGPATAAPDAPSRGEGLGGRLRALLGGTPDEAAWRSLEEALLRADVGPRTAARIVADLRARHRPGADPAALLAEEVESVLGGDEVALHLPEGRLGIVLVVGVNGSGKTTTIGKLAARLRAEGKRVALAASDTYRAAAAEQLQAWAERAGAQLIAQQRGADPGAVTFDAVKAAEARGMDVLIVDTAGRLHTKVPLMDELRKVRRVIEKAAGRGPDETLLVLDATAGQNGIAQARAFTEAVEVTGVALAKLDGTAKGGVVLAVREALGVPVKLVGTGERPEDLEPFDARRFAERLLEG
ncbi:MAG: signal recognition particle receptor FtsY [Actinomycetota bacterium]|nr:MAG: signal recognition particle receptor FtsY [Actinomycetota bacterium]